ncbi:EAL domain-containing protein [Curvivirga aplysinae]|uniref:EAL domain-containing protein n=1 Tax=Curvivirga aplysinae TaxID=2529852 RepID=UPI001C3FB27F|nr:EAL domain-containing protein [Curvivirga aplysinae]
MAGINMVQGQPFGRHSQENLLLDYAERLKRYREGRRAVHIHLSRLRPQHRRPHHLRIAANTIEDFIFAFEGQLFRLGNTDMLFVVKDADLMQLDDIVMRLRTLFSEDPVASINSTMEGHGRFATLYSLDRQYDKFLELSRELTEAAQQREKRLNAMASQTEEDRGEILTPLSPDQLGRLEEVLKRTDLSNVFKRQTICAVSSNSDPTPVFNELYISIMELARMVLPEVNLAANRWLFQHLTETLDRRVLHMLSKADDRTLFDSFSINLNVNTLLSPEFLQFDANLHTGSRGTLVVEMQIVDIMADFSAFLFARDFVKEKGYRICLDGITPDLLSFIDRKKMGVDLIKLTANGIFNGESAQDKFDEVAQYVEEAGQGRIILSRCDNKLMIENGQKMGITMFQGHYLDGLLTQRNRENSPPPPHIRRQQKFI